MVVDSTFGNSQGVKAFGNTTIMGSILDDLTVNEGATITDTSIKSLTALPYIRDGNVQVERSTIESLTQRRDTFVTVRSSTFTPRAPGPRAIDAQAGILLLARSLSSSGNHCDPYRSLVLNI